MRVTKISLAFNCFIGLVLLGCGKDKSPNWEDLSSAQKVSKINEKIGILETELIDEIRPILKKQQAQHNEYKTKLQVLQRKVNCKYTFEEFIANKEENMDAYLFLKRLATLDVTISDLEQSSSRIRNDISTFNHAKWEIETLTDMKTLKKSSQATDDIEKMIIALDIDSEQAVEAPKQQDIAVKLKHNYNQYYLPSTCTKENGR